MAQKKLPPWASTVTPFSKALALGMLIVLPICGFYYGRYYQQQVDLLSAKIYNTVQPQVCLPPNGTISCNTSADCPTNYTCVTRGPLVSGKELHSTCWKKGSAIPL